MSSKFKGGWAVGLGADDPDSSPFPWTTLQTCLASPTVPYPHGNWFEDFIPLQQKVTSALSTPLYVRPRVCKSWEGSIPCVLFVSQSPVLAPLGMRVKCQAAGVLAQGEHSASTWDTLPQPALLQCWFIVMVCPGLQILLFIKVY